MLRLSAGNTNDTEIILIIIPSKIKGNLTKSFVAPISCNDLIVSRLE